MVQYLHFRILKFPWIIEGNIAWLFSYRLPLHSYLIYDTQKKIESDWIIHPWNFPNVSYAQKTSHVADDLSINHVHQK